VTEQEVTKRAWADVDIALQRRADLIPSWWHRKGSRRRKDIMESGERAVANAQSTGRSRPTGGWTARSGDCGGGGELPAAQIQRELPEAAGRTGRHGESHCGGAAQVQRAVQKYNTTIGLFPNNVFAGMLGFQRNDAYFKTDPGARTAPAVKF
jgi:LemA protein